jgi:hypothetical protein
MDRGSLHSANRLRWLTLISAPSLPAPDGFFLECGFSGTGFKIAPAVGACMAEWIVDGRPKTVDVTGFSLDRFAEGRRLKGEHAYGEIWQWARSVVSGQWPARRDATSTDH